MMLARIGATALAATALFTAVPAHAAPPPAQRGYIVTLKATLGTASAGHVAHRMAARYGGHVTHTYSYALHGFSAILTPSAAAALARDPAVAMVEPNHAVRIAATTQHDPPSWGLDRIDQGSLPLSHSYTYSRRASAVHAYVIDTGIRTTHHTFGGRAYSGWDFVDNDKDATDCNGHGTHVAGTIGGSSYGVAKAVTLIAVRVLDCDGAGDDAGVIAGVDWVTAHAAKPAVANMSIGGDPSASLDAAVRRSISSGITYGIAAGNGDDNGHAYDACKDSPSRVTQAIVVGATSRTDYRAPWSNFGPCLDLFAPGVDILSAWWTGNYATATISGTSMATPHVVGAAALYLAAHPLARPAEVRDALVAAATKNLVHSAGTGSLNRLLRVV
ncbi:MAG: hypothetical protein QOJ50_2194 [Cryptosporangiaceae bacterium]|nr:hypothetical protein [Cryptosporangiaceae bacterium]